MKILTMNDVIARNYGDSYKTVIILEINTWELEQLTGIHKSKIENMIGKELEIPKILEIDKNIEKFKTFKNNLNMLSSTRFLLESLEKITEDFTK